MIEMFSNKGLSATCIGGLVPTTETMPLTETVFNEPVATFLTRESLHTGRESVKKHVGS